MNSGFAGVDIYGTGLKIKPDLEGEARLSLGMGGKTGVSAQVCVDVNLPFDSSSNAQEVFVSAITDAGEEVAGRLADVAEQLGWGADEMKDELMNAMVQLQDIEFSPQPGEALGNLRTRIPELVANVSINDRVRARFEEFPEMPSSVNEFNPCNSQFLYEIPDGPLADALHDLCEKADIGKKLKSTIETVEEIACNICGRVDGTCDISGCGNNAPGPIDGSQIDPSREIMELEPLGGNASSADASSRMSFGLLGGPRTSGSGVEVSFSMAGAAHAAVSVYSISGSQVRRLTDGELSAGVYKVVWDGRDDAGARVANGIYFLRYDAAGFVDSRKVALRR